MEHAFKEIKDPEHPNGMDRQMFKMDELEEFFIKDGHAIKDHLNNVDDPTSRFRFSVSSEKMCLLTRAESFMDWYKELRVKLTEICDSILDSNKDLIIESVEVPIMEEGAARTCFIKVNFKRK